LTNINSSLKHRLDKIEAKQGVNLEPILIFLYHPDDVEPKIFNGIEVYWKDKRMKFSGNTRSDALNNAEIYISSIEFGLQVIDVKVKHLM